METDRFFAHILKQPMSEKKTEIHQHVDLQPPTTLGLKVLQQLRTADSQTVAAIMSLAMETAILYRHTSTSKVRKEEKKNDESVMKTGLKKAKIKKRMKEGREERFLFFVINVSKCSLYTF